MNANTIHSLLDMYRRLFDFDDISAYDELESQAMDQLLDNGQGVDPHKLILKGLAQNDYLRRRADKVFEHFQSQVEADQRDFSHWQSGDPLEDDEVEFFHETSGHWQLLPHCLVKKHWDLVRKAAVKYHDASRIDPELEFDDLMSISREALLVAAQKMSEEPRSDFRKFALQTMKDRIMAHKNERHPVPFKIRKKLAKLRETRESLEIHSHDEEATKTLAESIGIDEQEMHSLYEIESIWGSGHMVDLGDRMEELEVPDLSPDALSLLIDQETSMGLSEAMTNLSDMQRSVVLQIYFRNLSFRQAADLLNISLSVVKKHHRNAMDKLKGHMD